MIEIASIIILLILIICITIFGRQSEDENFRSNVFKDYYYFDANATTPMSSETANILYKSSWLGNASTDYATSTGAASVIGNATQLVKAVLNAPIDASVVFNSGCSEGNSYVFKTVATMTDNKKHVIVSAFEHKSIISCVNELVRSGKLDVTWIMPNSEGIIDPVTVAESVQSNTVLISVMHVNNELGTIQPLEEIGKVAKHFGIIFHSDIAQSFCKLEIDMIRFNLDIVTTSSHKVYGPVGSGLIVMTKRVTLLKCAQIHGAQFDGLRGGTENLAAIAASAHSIQTTYQNRHLSMRTLLEHKKRVLSALQASFTEYSFENFCGKADDYIPHYQPAGIGFAVLGKISLPSTILLSFFKVGNYTLDKRFCNIKLKQALFERRIIVSIGSACNTHATGPSHVLMSIKAPFVIRSGVIRISFTKHTTPEDVDYLIKNLIECVLQQVI